MNDLPSMGTTVEYEWFAVALSVVCLFLSLVYLRRVIHSFRVHHDDRAAVALAKGIGLTVIAFGLALSASAFVLEAPVMSIAGLSIARGAFFALIATLLLAHVRPQSEDDELGG